jgi:hypothetical protein
MEKDERKSDSLGSPGFHELHCKLNRLHILRHLGYAPVMRTSHQPKRFSGRWKVQTSG